MINPSLTPASIPVNSSSTTANPTQSIPNTEQWLRALSVRRKISLGYALILGLVTTGTTIGVIVGDRAQRQALEQQQHTQHEIQIFHQAQLGTLRVAQYAQIVGDSENPSPTDAAILHESIHTLQQAWGKLIELQSLHGLQTEAHLHTLPQFTEAYTDVVSSYLKELDQLQHQVSQGAQESRAAFKEAQEELEDFHRDSLTQQFLRISPELDRLIAISYQEYAKTEAALKQATIMRLQIILMSIVISVGISILLAAYVSRLIVQPLKSATVVARQVSQEANFNLQVPITTSDEVGQLSQALNQLITQVQQLLEEQKATQTQLIQSEKMSSLGQMVAGIAHEINNPVNFIYGNLTHAGDYTQSLLQLIDLYQQHYPHPPEAIETALEEMELEFLAADLTKLMQSMRIGTERIREIVLSLRNFSRIDESEIKNVNLHEGIDSTLIILQNRLKANSNHPEIQIVKEYGDLPLVSCYAGQLNQVFMNILSNAIDALEEHNSTRSLEEIHQHPSVIRIRTTVLASNDVMISIADNGAGIPAELQSKLFDPFFTTKRIGKGTGLGLAISYQVIVEKHEGTLKVDSTPGEGAEFVITLPLDSTPSQLKK